MIKHSKITSVFLIGKKVIIIARDSRIKGITISIGGETTGLQKALSDVDKKSRDLTAELKQVDRALKFNPGNVELLAQKQQLLTEQVENTTERLNRLKSAQSQVETQFKSGDIGAEQYRAFQRELIQTESKLDSFKKELASLDDVKSLDNLKKDFKGVSKEAEEAENSVKDLGVELENIAGALVAGGGISGAVDQALDMSTLDTKIDITFDVPEESKQTVKNAVLDIQAYGVDSEAALEGVRRQWALNADATDEANQKVVEGAAAIAASYSGIDFTELIQETNEISAALKISDEEALALTNSLLQIGFPPEQLDIIAEYGTQLSMAGYSAEEVQAIFAAGVETDSWNIDNLLDGLKEGRIRLAEFGQEVPKSTQDLIVNTDISTKQLQEWGKAAARGGEDGKKAMYEVAQAVNDVEDETTKSQLGVAVWGTKFEDQGQAIIDTILNAEDATIDLKSATDGLTESTEKINADPAVKMQQALRDLKQALEPVLSIIADIISKIADWISEHPELAAAITAIVTALGIVLGALLALAPIIFSIINIAKILGVVIGALTSPIGLVIAAIVALIAIGIALYKNWDEIKAKAIEIWGKIKEWFFGVLDSIKQFFSDTWASIKESVSTTWTGIKNTLSTIWEGIKEVFFGALESIKNFFYTTWEGIKEWFAGVFSWLDEKTGGTFSAIFDSIKAQMELAWEIIKLVWDWIKESTKNALDFLKALITLDFEGMKEAIGNQLENTFNLIKGVWENIKKYAAEIWEKIKEIFFSVIDKIKTTIAEKFDAMKESIHEKLAAAEKLIRDTWKKIKDFFKSINLKQIGKDIFQGLLDGIKEMTAKIWKEVTDIASGIKSKFTGLLDINSPSGVFKEYGININEGLIEGIRASTSKLNSAVQDVYSGLGSSAQEMMRYDIPSSNSSSASPINIINQGTIVGSRGMEEFADTVGKALGKKYGLSTGGAY